MCFKRSYRDEGMSRGRRPTSEDIRRLFERYRRPIRVRRDAAREEEPQEFNGQTERRETLSRSPSEDPVALR
jgi:hypothetical protein